MKSKLQGAFIILTIFILFMTVIEYLLKFGIKEFSFLKLMEIIPRMALDFGLIALVFIVFYLIKYKRNKQE